MAGRKQWRVATSYAVLSFMLFLTMIPYMVMVIRSFKSLNQTGISQIFPTLPLHYGNYIQAWSMIAQFMLNSVAHGRPDAGGRVVPVDRSPLMFSPVTTSPAASPCSG